MKKIKLRSNQLIYCIENDHITKKIEKDGIYEVHLFNFLTKLLSKNKNFTCLDVGANIGVVSLVMSKYAKHVISFEPIKSLFSMIEKSIEANNIKNCKVINKGLSSTNTMAKIYINTSGNIGSSTLSKTHSLENSKNTFNDSEVIDLEAGDDNEYLKSIDRIDLIKIDVEGHESDVVIGMQEIIKKNDPLIILEWNNKETKDRFISDNNLKRIFKKYHPFILTNNKKLFREKTQSNKFLFRFRSILRILYQLFHSNAYLEQVILKDSFNLNGHYSSIVLFPESKKNITKDFKII
jgi:FkbM family methyltransferase